MASQADGKVIPSRRLLSADFTTKLIMKMKTILTTVSALALITLAGCGKPANETSTTPPPTNSVSGQVTTNNSGTAAPAAETPPAPNQSTTNNGAAPTP